MTTKRRPKSPDSRNLFRAQKTKIILYLTQVRHIGEEHTGICHIFIDIVKIIQQHFPPIQELVERFGRTAMSQINVTDLREIENDFSFLSPEKIAAIRTFWSSFYPKGDTPNQEQFLAVWQILYALYTDLREALATEGKGYEGYLSTVQPNWLPPGRSSPGRLSTARQSPFPLTSVRVVWQGHSVVLLYLFSIRIVRTHRRRSKKRWEHWLTSSAKEKPCMSGYRITLPDRRKKHLPY